MALPSACGMVSRFADILPLVSSPDAVAPPSSGSDLPDLPAGFALGFRDPSGSFAAGSRISAGTHAAGSLVAGVPRTSYSGASIWSRPRPIQTRGRGLSLIYPFAASALADGIDLSVKDSKYHMYALISAGFCSFDDLVLLLFSTDPLLDEDLVGEVPETDGADTWADDSGGGGGSDGKGDDDSDSDDDDSLEHLLTRNVGRLNNLHNKEQSMKDADAVDQQAEKLIERAAQIVGRLESMSEEWKEIDAKINITCSSYANLELREAKVLQGEKDNQLERASIAADREKLESDLSACKQERLMVNMERKLLLEDIEVKGSRVKRSADLELREAKVLQGEKDNEIERAAIATDRKQLDSDLSACKEERLMLNKERKLLLQEVQVKPSEVKGRDQVVFKFLEWVAPRFYHGSVPPAELLSLAIVGAVVGGILIGLYANGKMSAEDLCNFLLALGSNEYEDRVKALFEKMNAVSDEWLKKVERAMKDVADKKKREKQREDALKKARDDALKKAKEDDKKAPGGDNAKK